MGGAPLGALMPVGYATTSLERIDQATRASKDLASAKDMIPVPIGPNMRMLAVRAPSYWATRSKLGTRQGPTSHTCINIRLPTHGGF